jgi:dTDP-4-amino-4,6-dideoxygalactose transaminase
MSYKVRFVKADEHYSRLKPEIDAALFGCISKGDLINRHQLKEFEENLATFVGTKYAVGVNSGYHALALSLLAAGVGPGHEVITVAHTFVATVSAIVHCGATPVLIDVQTDHNMDPDLLEAAITPRTKAIIPVHLNGRICEMDRIQQIADKHKLLIIEDAAQGLGASFKSQGGGSFGIAGCFSFYPFKMLGCFGDGGAVTTNDPAIARAIVRMRYNGEDRQTGEYHYHGFTALLDNVQAAVLNVKLPHLSAWIEHRRRMAEQYQQFLGHIEHLVLPNFGGKDYYESFQNYVIRTPKRDELRAFLKDRGVETLVSWAKPMWHHLALRLGDYSLPETEAICREVLSLPMSSELTPEEVKITAEAICEFFGTYKASEEEVANAVSA